MLLYRVSVWKNILYGQKVQVFKVGHSDMVGQYTWYPTRNRIGIRKRTEKKIVSVCKYLFGHFKMRFGRSGPYTDELTVFLIKVFCSVRYLEKKSTTSVLLKTRTKHFPTI